MDKRLITFFLMLFICLILTGCGMQAKPAVDGESSKQNMFKERQIEPPEPYELSLQEINNSNYDMALKYLDLTINDFPDSIYTNNAHSLKCIIYNTKLLTIAVAVTNLSSGLDVMSSSYLTESDKDDLKLLKSHLQALQKEENDIKDQFYDEVIFAINSEGQDKLYFYDIKVDSVGDVKEPFEWFAKFGTPVPTINEFKSDKNEFETKITKLFINQIINNGSIDLPLFYYSLLISSYRLDFEKDIQRALADKVLQLTEEDKYNKYRLETQDIIKEKLQ